MLKKELRDVPLINELNFDEFCIASAEGLLEENDQARLNEYLALHPGKQPVFDVYGKLVLRPDYLLTYPGKKELKKQAPLTIAMRLAFYALSAAAAVALLLLLVSRNPAEQSVAVNGQVKSGADQKQNEVSAAETKIPVVPEKSIANAIAAGRGTKLPEAPEDPVASSSARSDIQPLEALDPVKTVQLSARTAKPGIHRTAQSAEPHVALPQQGEIAYEPVQTPASILGSLVRKLNLWKAAETAVTGFNYLTESRLSLVKTTDADGKFSGLSVEEDYVVSGNKIK
jgi:hypothetical protein